MKIFWTLVAFYTMLMVFTLFNKLYGATRPPVLVAAFNEETQRVNASPEDIIQYEAQVWQESGWRQFAKSKYAQGPTQFTPGTRRWRYPMTTPSCAGVHWSDPNCAFRAQFSYMKYTRGPYMASPDVWAFGQAGYNGGPTWTKRERRLCAALPGCDPRLWWGHVEKVCHPKRTRPGACEENRNYPIHIRRHAARLRLKANER